jgi:N-formylglutamate amidohydrolase
MFLLHIPHSGTKIPNEFINDYLLSEKNLKKQILEYCDLHTDKIYQPLKDKFKFIQFEQSRMFCDVERFFDDKEEDMYLKYKLGWFYETQILNNKPLRNTKNKNIISKYYIEHHNKLNNLTDKLLKKYGTVTILDLHSFSNEKYWFQDKDTIYPDICIGFEDYHKDNRVVAIIQDLFKNFNVSLNKPYTGSLVPINYYKKNPKVKSVMIEINKKLYLNEEQNISTSGLKIIELIKILADKLDKL